MRKIQCKQIYAASLITFKIINYIYIYICDCEV